jgi:murein L,D-transpeptidase YafK
MAGIRGNIFMLLRLFACLLLLSFISPAADTTSAKPEKIKLPASFPDHNIRIVIWKSYYTLTLYKGDRPVKSYRAVFGKGYLDGDKRKAGDKRTPEGEFYICTMNHSKRFYKFMGLSYPGMPHAENGLRERLISQREYMMIKKANEAHQQPPWYTKLGGAVGIHGRMLDSAVAPRFFPGMNWTDGCIALENTDIDEIFSTVSIGTPVTILP